MARPGTAAAVLRLGAKLKRLWLRSPRGRRRLALAAASFRSIGPIVRSRIGVACELETADNGLRQCQFRIDPFRILIWYRGSESNRHGVTTTGF